MQSEVDPEAEEEFLSEDVQPVLKQVIQYRRPGPLPSFRAVLLAPCVTCQRFKFERDANAQVIEATLKNFEYSDTSGLDRLQNKLCESVLQVCSSRNQ